MHCHAPVDSGAFLSAFFKEDRQSVAIQSSLLFHSFVRYSSFYLVFPASCFNSRLLVCAYLCRRPFVVNTFARILPNWTKTSKNDDECHLWACC